MDFYKVKAHALHAFMVAAFRGTGFDGAQAQRAADVLHYADLNGHDTHGVANLANIYLAGARSGEIDPQAEGTWVADLGACATFDARGGLGLLAGQVAMTRALDKARDFGIGCTVVNNSSHFGAAGFYASMALDQAMIGMAMTNLGRDPVAHPLGSVAPLLGTNPISFAAPSAKARVPFVLDMSTTVCASGKIKQAMRLEREVPTGWLFDAQGGTSRNPRDYLDQTANLPMLGGAFAEQGGHKGMGLGLMVEILCGALAGAQTGADKGQGPRNNIGHFFLAINPSFFSGNSAFTGSIDALLGSISGAPVHPAYAPLSYPGQPDAVSRVERLEYGIRLDSTLVSQLDEVADHCAIPRLARVAL
ncbi:Ldh family oxidoreductase [Pseudomonas sp. B329]|uniref:Ldh family oxidoreductase n=1 Tax=Pseudomonas sp. B329 TaxID=1553459 RepID=UPI0020051730|nr:Ldh family oxidoreductase [Pseudomonas sp. B329]MCK3860978.1 Ldh family oxidoreductase [Pseudomonas sp. B329]